MPSNIKSIKDKFKILNVKIETMCRREKGLSMYHRELKVFLYLHMNVQGMYAQMWPIDIPNCHL